MQVFVLLFNARTENEGIHTIRIGDRDKVLMFEAEDDATRYSLMLEAQDFPAATVEAIDDEEIKEFCQSADYDWELIPDGALAIPPEANVEEMDWQLEPHQKQEPTASEADPADSAELSNPELEAIRRRLEGLL